MKTHIFHGYREHTELQQLVNQWLNESSHQVLDIEFGYTTDATWGWYSAMIKYDDRAEGGYKMQVHIFHGHREYSELESKINSWVRDAENRGLEIVDIKYGYTTDRTWGWYSAMVIYKNR